MEQRTNSRGRTSYRVRFRHEGRNRVVTFATEAAAQRWRELLDLHGYHLAMSAIPSTPPDLDEFTDSIVPRSGQRIDPFGCFVYMLWGEDRNRPVYVGATSNLPKRLWDHTREKAGMWATYSLIRCTDETTMWRVEAKLIRHYRPELNIQSGRVA